MQAQFTGPPFAVTIRAMIAPAIIRDRNSDTPPPATDGRVELRDLSVRHARRLALDSVSGTFQPGSLTAVIGPNGAGKSTLLDAIAGLLRPHRGEVVCPARTQHRIAYLPQQARIDRDYPVTVAEIIGLGRWQEFGSLRAPTAELAQQIAEAADAVGVANLLHRRIAELSVGQMQRALFARLLLMHPQVLLLDEPFAAVDVRTVDALLVLIHRWHQQQCTVIAVVHDFDQVRAHFPSTLVLARTRIAWGETAAALSEENLSRAFA